MLTNLFDFAAYLKDSTVEYVVQSLHIPPHTRDSPTTMAWVGRQLVDIGTFVDPDGPFSRRATFDMSEHPSCTAPTAQNPELDGGITFNGEINSSSELATSLIFVVLCLVTAIMALLVCFFRGRFLPGKVSVLLFHALLPLIPQTFKETTVGHIIRLETEDIHPLHKVRQS